MKKFDMEQPTSSQKRGFDGMTHFVNLPTGGKFYPKGHPLKDISSLEIKMLTTKQEEILTNQSYIDNGIAIDRFLESIILEEIDSKNIYEQDKIAILIAARIEAYGEDYPVVNGCTKCSEIFPTEIDLNNILESIKQSELETTDDGTFIVELPKSKSVVEFKSLLPNEISSIEKTVEKMKKLNIDTTFNDEFYKRIIVSVNGDEDREKIGGFISSMRILDSRTLNSAYVGCLPSLNMKYKFNCPNCDHENEEVMPVAANFFFPDL